MLTHTIGAPMYGAIIPPILANSEAVPIPTCLTSVGKVSEVSKYIPLNATVMNVCPVSAIVFKAPPEAAIFFVKDYE